ncbi:hypothetical protein TD95_001929 [Thielaviopsis punctulata]|uniref:NADP-dependent oxidoreductase domain-containing protein n=1 Tax=Thielaviopsis punctulata TaxID=72032 RepID=A0A0F4ZFG6_9PEZI|nr:hypothetical protein TD95_001929 [Thielaviopsis punctulata]
MPLVVQQTKPRVILGLMTFGPSEESGARVTKLEDFNACLDTFQARGYNEVDTARVYVGRQQEAFTREAKWKERGLTLATKIEYPAKYGTNTAANVAESADISLKELGGEQVDFLKDRGVPFAQTLEAIDKLHKAGKFVRFGISNFTAYEVAEIVMTCKYNNWVRPTVYQAMYNMITRNAEIELFRALRRYGIDIVVYNPIAGGLFSGKIKSADMVPESGRFSDTANSGAQYRKRYFRDSTFAALQLIETAAEKHGLSVIEVALRWVVHHSALKVLDGNDGVIIGVSRKEQIEENLTHLEKGPLPADVVEAAEKAWATVKAEATPYWHGEVEYQYDTTKALFG